MKMFKHNICQGKLQTSIPNPFDVEKKISLLFDPTHLLKCVYNNFRNKETFLCPTIDVTSDSNPSLHVNVAHIKEMYNLELGKNLKIAYKLSEKVLNSLILEKTNVMLADACFHESTINGLKHYGERGYPHKIARVMFNLFEKNLSSECNIQDILQYTEYIRRVRETQ